MSRWLVVGGVSVLVALCPLGSYLLFHAPYDAKVQRLSEELEAHLAELEGGSWERPVHRGEPIDGDAYEEAARLLSTGPIARPLELAELDRLLTTGEPLPPDAVESARREAERLEALRATTRRTRSHVPVELRRGVTAPFPEMGPHILAARQLLVLGVLGEPDECLRIGADVVRLGQDLSLGTGMLGVMIAAAHATFVARVSPHCATRASPEALAEVADEMAALAEHATPTGAALEIEMTAFGVTLREMCSDAPILPTSQEEMQRLRDRADVVEAWQLMGVGGRRFRSLTGAHYPRLRSEWERVQSTWAAAGNPVVDTMAPDLSRYLIRDAAAQAYIRAMALGLATLAARSVEGALPERPPGLESPGLADPFTGQPMRFRVEADALVVWSVGEDGVDDQGAHAFDSDTPPDVSVRFPLSPPPRPRVGPP